MQKEICPQPHSPRQPFIKGTWLRINARYLPLGIVIGISIYLLLSAFQGEFMRARSFTCQMISSVLITLSITNSVYFAQLLVPARRSSLTSLFTYYLSSALGLLVGTELAYFLFYLLFGLPYTFFHAGDLGFSVCIMMIVCTALYVRGVREESLQATLQEKELALLKLKQVNTQAELATLQAKINPHFLYNALNAVAGLVHSDPDKAEAMTLQLSKLFRYSISQSSGNLVTVSDELEIVKTYLEIEKVRFGERINFEFDVDAAALNEKMPRFLIQPLIENALKHGLNNVAQGGRLTTSIAKNERLEIAVADNGTPFPDDYDIGYGLQSTFDKLGLLYPGAHEVYIRNTPVKEVRVLIPLTP